MVKQITTRLPMTPPTIAPRFIASCLEEVGVEFITALELDEDTEDVSTTVAIRCEAELVKELLGREADLDGVVVASTAFGTGKSLSVRACAPQAMYSKDWSGPLISSKVEQNCERSLIILSSKKTIFRLTGYGMTDHEKVVMSARSDRRPQPSVQE